MFDPNDKESLIAIKVNGSDTPPLKILQLTGTEAISSLFEFELLLVSQDGKINLSDLIGKKISLAIRTNVETVPQLYHGLFRELEQQDQANDYYYYRAVLVPRVWVHTQNKINDVYINTTIPTLIQNKLSEFSLTSLDFTISPSNTDDYPNRSFIAQYEESNFAFVSRSMEAAGLYYYFDHGTQNADNEILKIIDHVRGHPAQTLNLTYVPKESTQTQSIEGLITKVSLKAKLNADTVTISGYNPEKASLQTITSSASVPGLSKIDVMEFNEKAQTSKDLDRLSKIRAEEIACSANVITAQSQTAGIRSGYFISIEKHFREDVNKKYLVTAVRHRATQAFAMIGQQGSSSANSNIKTEYECELQAIPSETQFRAPRTSAVPKISGLLNAKIDDGTNQTDSSKSAVYKDGHYKVQPYYIKGSKSAGNGSSELRMLTPYAGGATGMQFGLRANCEVLLAFINGDPDMPIIVGATFNSEEASTLVPQNQSEHIIKTHGGLAVLFDDTSGKEKMTIFGQGTSVIIGKNGHSLLDPVNFTGDLFSLF